MTSKWTGYLFWLNVSFLLLSDISNGEFIIERRPNQPDILQLLNTGTTESKQKWFDSKYFDGNVGDKKKQCKWTDRQTIASIKYDNYKLACYTRNEIKTECPGTARDSDVFHTMTTKQTVKYFTKTCAKSEWSLEMQILGIQTMNTIVWQQMDANTEDEIRANASAIEFVNRDKWDGLLVLVHRRCNYNGNTECLVLEFSGRRKYPFTQTNNIKDFISTNILDQEPPTISPHSVTPSKNNGGGGGGGKEISSSSSSTDATPAGVIIGVVVVCFAVAFLVVCFILLYRRRQRRRFRNSQRQTLTSNAVYAKCEVDIQQHSDNNANNGSPAAGGDKIIFLQASVSGGGNNQYAAVSNQQPEYREIEPELDSNKYDLPTQGVIENETEKTASSESDVYHAPGDVVPCISAAGNNRASESSEGMYHVPEDILPGDNASRTSASESYIVYDEPDDNTTTTDDEKDILYNVPDVETPLMNDGDDVGVDYEYSTPINDEPEDENKPRLSMLYAKVTK